MLDETYHCDGPGCENTTPKQRVSSAWRVVLWLSAHEDGTEFHPTQDRREWHYCSRECEHNATAPEGIEPEPHPYTAIRKEE